MRTLTGILILLVLAVPCAALTDSEIINRDPACGWWVMDGDGWGGRWDGDKARANAKLYRGDKMPWNGNFTLHHVDPVCLKRTAAQWVAADAERKRLLDAQAKEFLRYSLPGGGGSGSGTVTHIEKRP